MAPRLGRKSEKEPLLGGLDLDTKKGQVDTEVKEEGEMGVAEKLMLSASLWGNEAACDFEQLYTMPILQTLGLPLSLVSLTGLIAGPTATLLLPLFGFLTDRGSNPERRKTIAIFLASTVMMSGLACVVIANVLHLTDLLSSITISSLDGNGSEVVNASTEMSDAGGSNDYPTLWDISKTGISEGETRNASVVLVEPDSSSITSQVSLKAALGLLGFILMDIGFDMSNSCSRSFVLTCSPRDQHTSLLVVALIMASGGGTSTAALGVVDFTSLLGLQSIEGARLTIQTTLQGVIVVMFIILGLIISLLTGRRRLKIMATRTKEPPPLPYHMFKESNTPKEDAFSRSFVSDVFENSIRSFGGGGVHFDHALVLLEDHQHNQPDNQDMSTETSPLLGDGDVTDQACRQLTSTSFSYIARKDYMSNIAERPFTVKTSLEDLPEDKVIDVFTSPTEDRTDDTNFPKETAAEPDCDPSNDEEDMEVVILPLEDDSEDESVGTGFEHSIMESGVKSSIPDKCQEKTSSVKAEGFKRKLVLISIAIYFATALLFLFGMTSSDYIGKAIYKGNPDAPPGSDSLARYQAGVSMASWGFFVYYASYLAISFVHHRVLAFLGHRGEFTVVNVLMIVTVLTLTFTERLEVYFVVSAMAGLHRACVYVVPFTVVNDLVFARAQQGSGQAKVGLAMSMVTAAMPLAYCTLYPATGPLEDLTGLPAVPLYMSAVAGTLSILAFLAAGVTAQAT